MSDDCRIGLLDPVARSLDGLIVLDLTPDFRLTDRLDVRRAQWTALFLSGKT